MGVHEGHRQRMKNRFLKCGLNSFEDINALEFLLFYSLPRQDTNELAHALLDRFGSLHGVMEADTYELQSVPGVGEHTAVLLRLIPELARRYMSDALPNGEPLSSPRELGAYFLPCFAFEKTEKVFLLLLDARRRPIACEELSRGTVNGVELAPRRIVELALERRACYAVLAHNHPSGVTAPSGADIQFTQAIQSALQLVDVPLADHIIVSRGNFSSMAQLGLLRC